MGKTKQKQNHESEELQKRLRTARERLFAQQNLIKEKKLPVLVVFDGYGAAGKGSVLGKLIQGIDPRFFRVSTMEVATREEKRKPFLYRYFAQIPEQGKFQFFDGSWMQEITRNVLSGTYSEKEYEKRIESVKRFERTLHDNGYLVMKFFFHISGKEQKKRLSKLLADPDAKWRVSEFDQWENEHHKECEKVYKKYLSDTDQSIAPWYQIDATSKKEALLDVLEYLVGSIDTALTNMAFSARILQNTFPMSPVPKLSDISLDQKIDDETYRKELKECQQKLSKLHNVLYKKQIPVVICYEGWDAAGKGGNIKRIAQALDPRGYEVFPIASPEPHEKARHFLWRFWTRLPKTGHIAIFDRTWYGRVMVERIEGFCSENDWQRAYHEINEFEHELSDWGAIVIKFWVQIDKDTQLERFTLRQKTPEKQWKITDEDWRNREKWDQYELAIDQMLQKTSTSFAPWHILESNDKRYARIKALKTVIAEIEKRV